MNRLRLLKIATPIIGVAAVGSVGGAIGYYFYKTAPEKWNNSLQEFREVHLGFDGNQMIGYLATGQYEDATLDVAQTVAKETPVWNEVTDAKKDHLLYGGEMEYHKVVYVKNLNDNAEGKANRVVKYELNFADREKSIIQTLPGKQGDEYQIVTRSEGITFRNPEIRKVVFQNIPDISLPAYQTNGKVDVKKIRNAINKLSDNHNLKLDDNKDFEADYDDEDIKSYSKDAGALFRLDYMSGDVSMGGVDGKVDTPTTSYVKSIDFGDINTTDATDGTLVGNPVAAGQIIKMKSDGVTPDLVDSTHPKYIYDDKKVTLNVMTLDVMGGIDNFARRLANPGDLTKPNDPTNAIYQAAAYMMPRAMADVSQDTQLIDKTISVRINGKVKELGKLERYNNELLVSDLNNIYSDKAKSDAEVAASRMSILGAAEAMPKDTTDEIAAKAAAVAAAKALPAYKTYLDDIERAHVGDLKITSWW